MSVNVKTNYMFLSDDASRVDSEKARKTLAAVQEVVRVTQVFGSPDVKISMNPYAEVVQAVTAYLSEPKFREFTIEKAYEIPMGSTIYRADVVLHDPAGRCAAIAECKLLEGPNYGPEPLKNFLNATHIPFGILASGVGTNSWHFYENLHDNQFRLIEQSDFERRIHEMSINELA